MERMAQQEGEWTGREENRRGWVRMEDEEGQIINDYLVSKF